MSRIPRYIKVKALAPFYPFVRPGKQTGIFMWHHGRCGSTVLGNLLNQRPDVRWHGEIFERYAVRGMHRARFRDDLMFTQVTSQKRSPGIEIKGLPCQHLSSLGLTLDQFVQVIEEHGFHQCVFLHRRNILRKLISVQILERGLVPSSGLAAGSQAGVQGRLTVDTQRVCIQGKHAPLLEMIRYIDEETAAASQILESRFEVLSLNYEDDVQDDPLVAYEKLCKHLGLEHCAVDVRLRRINTKDVPDLVQNYGEVEDVLSGTPYEWMLTA